MTSTQLRRWARSAGGPIGPVRLLRKFFDEVARHAARLLDLARAANPRKEILDALKTPFVFMRFSLK
jgi:hypothetical protein